MLNVDEAYLSSSQPFIQLLLSGVQENGNCTGRGGEAVCGGHEHCTSWETYWPLQPPPMDHIALRDSCGELRESGLTPRVAPTVHILDGKSLDKSPKFSSDS